MVNTPLGVSESALGPPLYLYTSSKSAVCPELNPLIVRGTLPTAELVNGSAAIIEVPLSVMLEFVGAPPAPPPFTRMFELRMPDEVSVVVLLKYGIPPEVTVPATVTG
jgi:hypothetical protein